MSCPPIIVPIDSKKELYIGVISHNGGEYAQRNEGGRHRAIAEESGDTGKSRKNSEIILS
jgi:hypothetical protein